MEIGLKYYSTNRKEKLRGIGFADFVEVLPVPGKFGELKKFKKFKCTVHAPHGVFGFNPADKKNEKRSVELMRETIKAADYLDAGIIVVHPGHFPEARCFLKAARQAQLDFFSKINDDRVVLENLMIEDNEGFKYVGGNNAEDMRRLLKKTGFGFCLDFSHAAANAVRTGRDYKKIINEFLVLKPDYFHVADNLLDGKDQHLHLGDGKLDVEFIRKAVKKLRKPVCLETPLDIKGRKKDASFLRG